MWLFHLHSTVKRQPFSPDFPLAESIAKAFFRLFLWNFKEKSINPFLGRVVIFVYNYLKPLKIIFSWFKIVKWFQWIISNWRHGLGLSLSKWLCHRKRLMPFSMTFQVNNQQNASAMKSAKGKTGEKAVFSPCCRDETTTYYDRPSK